jgi:metal-dependent amidase/aminoacylase/carboxypeptidase family protein
LSASSTRAGTAATDADDEIASGYPGLRADQEEFYKDPHAHPELSHHERRTARCVAGKLATYGRTVQTQPTLRSGAEAMMAAAMAWLAPE